MSNKVPTPGYLPPPFLDIVGIANFRDIGGYPAAASSSSSGNENQSIRRRLVFRCADPSAVEPTGLAKLHDLGVKKVYDLRSSPEIKKEGPEWKGVLRDESAAFTTREDGDDEPVPKDQVERIWCPVFVDKDYGPEQVALRYAQYAQSGSKGFVEAYSNILDAGTKAYKTILSHLAQENPEPCIVHCTAGKDRTGVLVALLFLVSGVSPAVIAQEYSLTDEGLKHLKPLFKERLLRNPALAGNEAGVDNMISSKAENILATIDLINQKYGGAEKYMLDFVGLSQEQLARLKQNLVVQSVPNGNET